MICTVNNQIRDFLVAIEKREIQNAGDESGTI
jgi:hypothetical protein